MTPAPRPTAPPQDLDAEEGVLGACLVSPREVDDVLPTLDEEAFFLEPQRAVFSAIRAVHARQEPVDPVTVTDELRATGRLEQAGGRGYVHGLADSVPAAANARRYAEIVRGHAEHRELRAAALRAFAADTPDGAAREMRDGVDRLGDAARRAPRRLFAEPWRTFAATVELIAYVVAGLLPVGALGFIAAAPKRGKTWLGLALAIAVAAGRPFLGRFAVPEAAPVVYVALEGHRAALRARIGSLARGMGLDPDGADLDRLHLVYKPRGINLSDPVWAAELIETVLDLSARLVVVDVLRRAARVRETGEGAGDFAALLDNLAPLAEAGTAVVFLHHTVKRNADSAERDPGERMSGSGALFGALDCGLFVTSATAGARSMAVHVETRDGAAPAPFTVTLDGHGSLEHGGFGYLDTATLEATDEAPSVEHVDQLDRDIAAWIAANGGAATPRELRSTFNLDAKTIYNRRGRLATLGVRHVKAGAGDRDSYYTTTPGTPENPGGPGLLEVTPEPRTSPLGESGVAPGSSDPAPTSPPAACHRCGYALNGARHTTRLGRTFATIACELGDPCDHAQRTGRA